MNCKKITLSECIEIIGGGTPKTSKKEYWGGEIPWLSVVDFNNDNRYVSKTEKTITQEGLNNCSSRLLGENDIILSARGTVGALAQLSKPMAFNQSCYGIRANELAINDYIYYLLKHSVSILKKNSYGSVFDTITRETFSRIEVLLPDLKTQKRISEVLGSLDNKIELNEKINQNLDWEYYFSICRKIIELEEENQNLEAQAQAIFKSWFVDFEPFGGKMPADWKTYKLGEFLPVITGKKNANVSSSKGKYPFFSCAQDTAWADEFSFDANAILVAGNGDFSVKFYNGKFEAYQRTYVLIPHNPTFTNWLYYVVKYNLERITSGARGSVIKFITKGNLEDFSFFAPRNLDKLTPIDFFNSTNNKIAENKLEILKLAQLRDTLLPKLMSGEIDVSDVAV